MYKNNLIETDVVSIIIGRNVRSDFVKAIKKYKAKVKGGNNTYITVGMEGTAERGVDLKTAKKLFQIMDEYTNLEFMLLLNEDISKKEYVPNNCLLGVTVSDIKDIYRIEMLVKSKATESFISFVPLKEDVIDLIDLDLVNKIKYFILEGSCENEKIEWEEELIFLRSEYVQNTYLVYDKSVQKYNYDMGCISNKLFGFRRLSWF